MEWVPDWSTMVIIAPCVPAGMPIHEKKWPFVGTHGVSGMIRGRPGLARERRGLVDGNNRVC